MTQSSRTLLARFFKVHPGFLVDDPEGFHTELVSDLRTTEGRLDVWLLQGSERFASDREVSDVLIQLARHQDTRGCMATTSKRTRGRRFRTCCDLERRLDSMQKNLRVETFGPFHHRRIKMRVRDCDRADTAASIDFGSRLIIQEGNAIPQQISSGRLKK